VSNFPFGFGPPERGDDDTPGSGSSGGQPVDPMALFGQMGGGDLGAALQQIGRMLSWSGGPVNWDLARDVARQTVAAGGAGTNPDPSVNVLEREQVREAVRLAEHWLDGATDLPAGTSDALAWSRAEWVEHTLPVWKQLIEPVAARVVDAMSGAMTEQMPGELPPEMAAMGGALAGQLGGMMRSMGGAMFGAQVGQALGSLAGEVLGSTDIGLPLGPTGRAVLLPSGVAAFGDGLGVPDDQVRLYLALREAAHHRLFGHVPWLRSRVVADIEAYARGITIDTARIEEAMGSIDPTNPESMQQALTGGLFEPQTTPEQQHALRRLETLLALIEGWVDDVVDSAAAPHLPSSSALRETVRRRRAAGGPAEATFASLVGLELRPRRLREAAALWAAVRASGGPAARDAIWAHPDLLPTADDLDDPEGFANRPTGEWDIATLEDSPSPDGGSDDGPAAGTDEPRG
jgi:putative hydrolase